MGRGRKVGCVVVFVLVTVVDPFFRGPFSVICLVLNCIVGFGSMHIVCCPLCFVAFLMIPVSHVHVSWNVPGHGRSVLMPTSLIMFFMPLA